MTNAIDKAATYEKDAMEGIETVAVTVQWNKLDLNQLPKVGSLVCFIDLNDNMYSGFFDQNGSFRDEEWRYPPGNIRCWAYTESFMPKTPNTPSFTARGIR